jgi:hypothetical protein
MFLITTLFSEMQLKVICNQKEKSRYLNADTLLKYVKHPILEK